MSLSYSPIFALLGISLIGLVTIDVVATNTTKIGEGALTRWWQQGVCRSFFRIYQHWQNRSILVWSGVFIVLGMVLIWILLLWLGWVAIFCSASGAVVDSGTQQPADFWARVYFAGFSISSLGTGDYVPRRAVWQVLTAVASLNGLLLTSLVISFVIPIAEAEAHRRRVALAIFYTGKTGQDLILNTWDCQQQKMLGSLLTILLSDLIELDQKHASFPTLHRFCNYRRKESVTLALATLDEALTIVELGMEEASPPQYCVARQAISGYLSSSRRAGVQPGQKVPPIPVLDKLRSAKLPIVSDRLWRARLKEIQQRRQHLLSMVEQSGWSWKHID